MDDLRDDQSDRPTAVDTSQPQPPDVSKVTMLDLCSGKYSRRGGAAMNKRQNKNDKKDAADLDEVVLPLEDPSSKPFLSVC
jgi:hypothetical protein